MLLHHHFVKTAKKYGSKLALVDKTTGKNVTYENALIASLILQNKFSAFEQGFTGVMLPTSAGCVLTVMGLLMSGRVPVMINYSTGAASNAEFARKKCDFQTIITSRALIQKIECPPLKGMVFIEDIIEGIGTLDKAKAALRAKLPQGMLLGSIYGGKPEDNVAILFTSGSEKEPKAVELTHRNIGANLTSIAQVLELTDKDSMVANLPFFHVFGLTTNLWLPLQYGMTIFSYANPLDFATICRIVKEERPTIMLGTPSFFWGYLRKSEPGDFESVRLLVAGADKCPTPLREAFMEKHGKVLYEGYGTTETSPVISVNLPGANKPGSVGLPLPGVTVRIENYETGEECSVGDTGKILVKGDLVMKGYFDDFEQTALRIRHGWYDTGDMGMLDSDGYLWHVGRLKRFVKIGGEMVSLVLVEELLEKLLPRDVQCCVVEVPDAMKGSKIAVALTAQVDEKAVTKGLSAQLPNIALPRHYVVFDDELPKMGSGKIDFRTITNMVRDRLQAQKG